MQEIIVEKPYQFVPPHRGSWLPGMIQKLRLVDLYLNYFEGITSNEVRHVDRLQESLRAGHGIILAPNHSRYADPLAIGWISRQAATFVYAMASWHLFHQNRLQSLGMRACGGFSVYREGLDRTSLDLAIEILSTAERPLVVFPEGTVFKTNDRLNPLLDGVAFLARAASRKRAKLDQGKVVIHPVAIKYLFKGNLKESLEPVLESLEKRLTWDEPTKRLSLLERTQRLSEGLFTLREIQYLGRAQNGTLQERKDNLIERLLRPLETEWIGRPQDDELLPRIKQLRTKIVPKLTEAKDDNATRSQLWTKLADIYVAQQIFTYPLDYLDTPTDTRLLETVERLEEDVLDRSTIHRSLHVILEIGNSIATDRPKPARGERDPIMQDLENDLTQKLDRLSGEAQPIE